jgi:hypothetical protein
MFNVPLQILLEMFLGRYHSQDYTVSGNALQFSIETSIDTSTIYKLSSYLSRNMFIFY